MQFIKKVYDGLTEFNRGGKNQIQVVFRRRLQMPLNIRRIATSFSLVLLFVFGVFAQAPTSGDVMRARVSKAKAFVAVKNYAAAIYELEGIKRETNDPTVNSVVQVMLMNCYLEQLDYKRAQALLTEIYNAHKANKPNSNYFAVAAQVVKGAKNQLDRYKSLGLNVADRTLPPEALTDVDKMRETLESVITHSKTLGENKKLTSDSMALLEEASKARSGLARDDYDAGRWKNEMDDARERLTASRTTVINTVDDGAPNPIDTSKTLATNSAPIVPKTNETATQIAPISNQLKPEKVETPKVETPKTETVAKNEPIEPPKVIETPKQEVTEKVKTETSENSSRERRVGKQEPQKQAETVAKAEEPRVETQPTNSENTAKSDSPIQVGSLIDYATSKVNPTYPPAAKTMRMTGTVKVEVLVNEDGSIAEVQKTSGPSMLQRAAVDALKKWKFKPFVKDGQAVKASGFVSFNFNL
jgi:TonB family protein